MAYFNEIRIRSNEIRISGSQGVATLLSLVCDIVGHLQPAEGAHRGIHGDVCVEGSVDLDIDSATRVYLELAVVQIIGSSESVELFSGAILDAEPLQSSGGVVVSRDGCILVARTCLIRG